MFVLFHYTFTILQREPTLNWALTLAHFICSILVQHRAKLLAWPGNYGHPTSASQVARTTGMHQYTWLVLVNYSTKFVLIVQKYHLLHNYKIIAIIELNLCVYFYLLWTLISYLVKSYSVPKLLACYAPTKASTHVLTCHALFCLHSFMLVIFLEWFCASFFLEFLLNSLVFFPFYSTFKTWQTIHIYDVWHNILKYIYTVERLNQTN